MKTIKLAYGVPRNDECDYKVLVVKNSTRYNPGEVITKSEVDELCGNATWDVTIVSLNSNT